MKFFHCFSSVISIRYMTVLPIFRILFSDCPMSTNCEPHSMGIVVVTMFRIDYIQLEVWRSLWSITSLQRFWLLVDTGGGNARRMVGELNCFLFYNRPEQTVSCPCGNKDMTQLGDSTNTFTVHGGHTPTGIPDRCLKTWECGSVVLGLTNAIKAWQTCLLRCRPTPLELVSTSTGQHLAHVFLWQIWIAYC